MPSHRPSGGRIQPFAVGVGQWRNGSPGSKRPFPFVSRYGSASANKCGPAKVWVVSPLAGAEAGLGAGVGGSGASSGPTGEVVGGGLAARMVVVRTSVEV